LPNGDERVERIENSGWEVFATGTILKPSLDRVSDPVAHDAELSTARIAALRGGAFAHIPPTEIQATPAAVIDSFFIRLKALIKLFSKKVNIDCMGCPSRLREL
jgi:hypothetical protein